MRLPTPRQLAALAIFLGALGPALPDSTPGSLRSLTQAIAVGLLAAAVYLGAPKPEVK